MKTSILYTVLLLTIWLGSTQSKTVTFDYSSAIAGSTYLWTSSSTWLNGDVPTATDDIVITGCPSCIGSTAPGTILIQIPPSTTANSVTFGGRDIVLSLQGDLTVGSFSFSGGAIFSDNVNNLRTITTATASFTRDTTNFCQFSAIGITSSATTSFSTVCTGPSVRYNNLASGTWNWNLPVGAFLYDGNDAASTNLIINNNGQMSFQTTSSSNSVKIIGIITNSGVFSVANNVEVTIGSEQSVDLTLPAPIVNNTGTIDIQPSGTLTLLLSTLNLLQGSQWTGSGLFRAIGYDDSRRITINQYVSQNFPGSMILEGSLELIGYGADFTVGAVDLRPIFLSGSGYFVVNNLNLSTHEFHNILTSRIYRSINVTNSLLVQMQSGISDMDISNNAIITIGSSATGMLRGGYFFSNDSTGSFSNYGAVSQDPTASLNFVDLHLPFNNYGTLSGSNTAGISINLIGGGQITGTVSTPTVAAGDLQSDAVGIISFGGGTQVNTGATFPGLVYLDTEQSDCASVNTTRCRTAGRFQINAPINFPTAIQTQGSYIVINSNGISFGDLNRHGGNIASESGARTITVARLLDTSGDFIATSRISSVTIEITGYINFTESQNSVALDNGGNIVVKSGAVLEVHQSLLVYSTDSGNITNHGSTIIYGSRYISKNFINDGQITLIPTAANTGTELEFNDNSLFTQTSNGIIRLNIYTTDEYDQLRYFTTPATCRFNGRLSVTFHFTPSINLAIPILEYQNTGACAGVFNNVTVTGLGQGQIGVLVYDIPRSGYAAYNGYLAVCSSSNTTCSTYSRFSSVSTTGTTPSATTGQSSSTTGTSSSSSSSSSVTYSFMSALLTALLIFNL